MICRNPDCLRISDLLVRPTANLALVALGRVEHGEERLPLGTMPPVCLVGRFVPQMLGLAAVVVFFAVVRAVISRLTQELRIQLDLGRQRHHGPHVQPPAARRVQTRDDRGARRRTDRHTRPHFSEAHSSSSQRIDVRSAGQRVAITTHVRAMVLAREPQDVRPVSSNQCAGRECSQQYQTQEVAGLDHVSDPEAKVHGATGSAIAEPVHIMVPACHWLRQCRTCPCL